MDITWKSDPNYQAALDYLSLKWDPATAKGLVQKLKVARATKRAPRDILRASKLKPLKKSDPGVKQERDKVEDGKSLNYILVVSLPVGADIADGYHRTSLAYWDDPENPIPVKIVNLID